MKEKEIHLIVASTPQNVAVMTGLYNKLSGPPKYYSNTFVLLPVDSLKDKSIVCSKVDYMMAMQGKQDFMDAYLHGSFEMYANKDSDPNNYPDICKMRQGIERFQEKTPALEMLVKAIKEKGFGNKRIGIDQKGMAPRFAAELKTKLPEAEIVDASALLSKTRTIKTIEEQDNIRKATQISFAAFLDMLKFAAPGTNQRKLCSKYRESVIKQGAIPGNTTVACGEYSFMPITQDYDYLLKKGDIIRVDMGCTWNGCISDFARTVVIGQASLLQTRYYNAVRDGVREILKNLKPGKLVSELYKGGIDKIRQYIPEFWRHHCGHGLGVEHEDPDITGDGSAFIEEDMVLCIEAPYYEIGFGGFALEQTVCVKECGLEFYTPIEDELIII